MYLPKVFLLAVLTLSASVLVSNPPVVHACISLYTRPIQRFQSASFVFVGNVTSLKVNYTSYSPLTFNVSEVLKGNMSIGTQTIYAYVSPLSCGPYFQVGKTYEVYASQCTYPACMSKVVPSWGASLVSGPADIYLPTIWDQLWPPPLILFYSVIADVVLLVVLMLVSRRSATLT